MSTRANYFRKSITAINRKADNMKLPYIDTLIVKLSTFNLCYYLFFVWNVDFSSSDKSSKDYRNIVEY